MRKQLAAAILLLASACGGGGGGGGGGEMPVQVPLNRSPTFIGGTFSVAENVAANASLSASDADGDALTYSISGGADAALFSLSGTQLQFRSPPNFEAPGDANGDNVYEVVVTAFSSTSSDSQAFAVTLLNRNEGIWITSNGNSWPPTATVAENSRAVTIVTAEDPDGTVPTFSIVGGADALASGK